jgi:hypothetical protein
MKRSNDPNYVFDKDYSSRKIKKPQPKFIETQNIGGFKPTSESEIIGILGSTPDKVQDFYDNSVYND